MAARSAREVPTLLPGPCLGHRAGAKARSAVTSPQSTGLSHRFTKRPPLDSGCRTAFFLSRATCLQPTSAPATGSRLWGHILHSEGEARSRELLAKTFKALASGGTIAVQEFLVNQRDRPDEWTILAVNMLVNTTNGNTWSFEEIGAWLEEADSRIHACWSLPVPRR